MKQIISSIIFVTVVFLSFLSIAQAYEEYPLSRPIKTTNISQGSWDGGHLFSNAYCLKFPEVEKAFEMTEIFYKNNAINLFRVTYEGRMMINIVASTLPKGRTQQEETERLYDLEKQGEELYNHNYNITKNQGAFGTVIGIRIKDVAPTGKNAIFPIVRPLYKKNKTQIQSMSAHRFFVRGPDRFEIAVFQMAPKNIDDNTERKMTERVTQLANETLSNFENCTSLLPIRVANY